MPDQFPAQEFDDWAAHYDHSVAEQEGFPFAGYTRLLQTVVEQAGVKADDAVLDLGTGTGNLAALAAARGADAYGLDFSAQMLALARVKLPQGHFFQADLRGDWPAALQRRFEIIVSAYVFHHFPLAEKADLAKALVEHSLRPGGRLVIGDIAFADQAAEEAVRRSLGEEWEQEYYWIVDQSLAALEAAGLRVEFIPVSFCAGVFAVRGK